MVDLEQKKKQLAKVAKKRQKHALEFSQQADQNIEKFVLKRFERLVSVKRFVFLWVGLFALLILLTLIQVRALSPTYQQLKPQGGGLFNEGLIGTFTNANPIYANSTADAAVSRLVFSGLLKYDNQNRLIGDLADSWKMEKNQTTYTVHLKKNLQWQDGRPLTAADVVFTYHLIQKPEAQSPLFSSWQGINVTMKDAYTVTFNLPDPLAAFPYSLVNGIVPQHLLEDILPSQMRGNNFNIKPVGSGPFSWKFVEVTGTGTPEQQQRVSLVANKRYYAGRPKLDGFSITTFSDEKHLIKAYKKKQVFAISGLDSLPSSLKNDGAIAHYTPYASIAMAFYNNSNPILKEVKVRQALTQAVDRQNLVEITGVPVELSNSPLLPGQVGYKNAQLPFNRKAANDLLKSAGWKKGADGLRRKDKQILAFTLRTQDSDNYTATARYLQRQWQSVGVKVDIRYYNTNELQAQVIANHDYDILLYSISVGADPDIFVYWDSSQASISSQGHLNLSEYKSSLADSALEAGRTRSDTRLRVLKYSNFLKAWRSDAPALALYQPNYLYVSRGPIFNYDRHADVSSTDRFSNVENWMIRQSHQNL